jgi:tetratricopeptide (TPR) repeat protein
MQTMRSGQLEQAASQADTYLLNTPGDPQMQFLKGLIQRDQGKTDAAIATFTAMTQAFPELPEPYNNLAVLLASQNQIDKAREALELAVRANPDYATAQENLGDLYAKLASLAYVRALQLEPGNAALAPKMALIRQLLTGGAKPNAQAPLAPVAPVSSPAPNNPSLQAPAPATKP